ncbi:MAG: SAM-dependent methyltransferase [Planctomycetota bacterium]|nr:SAM-dependent methyltransferase [Planctomycetota bacterium]
MDDPAPPLVSRGGLKLAHALHTFSISLHNARCADFGANVGGFTDCMLRAGAASVHALDTGYGSLAWKLRTDPRVIVRERTNALHADPPPEGVHFVAVDMAWTPQRLCVPAALRWLARADNLPQPLPCIVTLIKPHYEASDAGRKDLLVRGVLDPADAQRILQQVLDALPPLGVRVAAVTQSPITGGAGKKKNGNTEFLALLTPDS